jgi:uncharacterized protein
MDQPTPVCQRIDAMDMLRGVAVLGILLVNINSFALPFEATFELTQAGYHHAIDGWVYAFVSAMAQGKFMSLFAMLFGAGVVMMAGRRWQAGESPAGLHYRRVGVLAAVGLIHGLLIWYGDILFPYAICGAILYPCLLLRGRKLLWLCLGLWGLVLVSSVGFGALMMWSESASSDAANDQSLFANETELMRGGLLDIMLVRIAYWLLYAVLGPFFGWPWMLALMMTGVLAARSGWITGQRPPADYARLLVVGLLVGLPVASMRVAMGLLSDSEGWLIVSFAMNVIDAAALSMAFGAIVMLGVKAWSSNWLGRALIAVGRMALTNYLAQSVICTLLFYGYGLGLFGSLSRTELIGVVLLVWAVQLLWSPWWLARHERGPLEAIWRQLTYPKARQVPQAGAR